VNSDIVFHKDTKPKVIFLAFLASLWDKKYKVLGVIKVSHKVTKFTKHFT